MEVDGQASSEIGQLGQSELDNQGRSGLGMSEFDLSSPLNYGTPSSNNPLASQGLLFFSYACYHARKNRLEEKKVI